MAITFEQMIEGVKMAAENQRQLEVFSERLARAMEREATLKSQNQELRLKLADAESQVQRLTQQIAEMHDHPDVKARRLAEAQAKLTRAAAEVQMLGGDAIILQGK